VTRILLVGCGKMGGAMLEGWLDQGLAPADVIVVDPAAQINRPGLAVAAGIEAIPDSFAPDVVVLAVKPQMMDAALPPYARFTSAVFLSIAAGKTLRYFAGHLGDVAIVRAMPNTPAAVRRGITGCIANERVSAGQRALCDHLLSSVGAVEWLEDEGLIDAVTAVSGSGPAYVFLLAETLAQAGVAAGLSEDMAARLARATVAGSGELLRQSDQTAATLRQNVTSPGGTTFAALQVLMAGQDGFAPLLTRAVAAAAKRSKELAG
jgi:pyrroline-5-carboxylate reductase